MRLTSRRLHIWHREFNALVFQNELERPVLVTGYCGPGTIGLCWGDRIQVSDTLSEQDARATLLHEMVHQWQDQNGLDMDHGKTFEQWRDLCRSCTGLEL